MSGPPWPRGRSAISITPGWRSGEWLGSGVSGHGRKRPTSRSASEYHLSCPARSSLRNVPSAVMTNIIRDWLNLELPAGIRMPRAAVRGRQRSLALQTRPGPVPGAGWRRSRAPRPAGGVKPPPRSVRKDLMIPNGMGFRPPRPARRFSSARRDRCEHVLTDTASMGAIFEKHP